MKLTKEDSVFDLIEGLRDYVRLSNVLSNAGILTIDKLIQYTPFELLKIRNFGKDSLRKILIRLEDNGLSLQPPTYQDKARTITLLTNIISELLKDRGNKNDSLSQRAKGAIARARN